jgi:hypothetical protein
MNKLQTYYIDNKPYSIEIKEDQEFYKGENIVLSNEQNDITFFQEWYPQGFFTKNFLEPNEFFKIKSGITDCIKNITQKVVQKELDDFSLENYHTFVTTDRDHFKIVSQTRDLFPEDFNFPISEMLPKFENILGFSLTDIDPNNKQKAHIILRINRPYSSDYNPPHKDIYEHFDDEKYVPKFVNFWVPICGVTENSSLPLAASTHLVPENLLTRTRQGCSISGNNYRVRLIKDWDGEVNLKRYPIQYGDVLIFSPHLIHGLAVNEQPNNTRVSLEFRLYKHG